VISPSSMHQRKNCCSPRKRLLAVAGVHRSMREGCNSLRVRGGWQRLSGASPVYRGTHPAPLTASMYVLTVFGLLFAARNERRKSSPRMARLPTLRSVACVFTNSRLRWQPERFWQPLSSLYTKGVIHKSAGQKRR
jgi:hypothetical protein